MKRSLATLPALAVAAVLLSVAPSAHAGPAARDTCLPIPGVPCLSDGGGSRVTATSPVTVSGTPKVDETLTATAPTWDNPLTSTSYQWMRGTVAIDGATSSSYVVQAADIGQDLTVVATGTFLLSSPGTSTSEPVVGLIGDAATNTATPTISGNATVGGELTATSGEWTSKGELTYGYQWYRSDGGKKVSKIAGATKKTYVPKVADAGRRLAVVVFASRAGHADGAAVSSTKLVAKLTSTTTLTATKRTVPAGRAPLVRVTLKGQGGTPAGPVTIYDAGTKKLVRVTITADDLGALNVTLPKLKPGKHTITALFEGAGSYDGSISKKLVLTVVK